MNYNKLMKFASSKSDTSKPGASKRTPSKVVRQKPGLSDQAKAFLEKKALEDKKKVEDEKRKRLERIAKSVEASKEGISVEDKKKASGGGKEQKKAKQVREKVDPEDVETYDDKYEGIRSNTERARGSWVDDTNKHDILLALEEKKRRVLQDIASRGGKSGGTVKSKEFLDNDDDDRPIKNGSSATGSSKSSSSKSDKHSDKNGKSSRDKGKRKSGGKEFKTQDIVEGHDISSSDDDTGVFEDMNPLFNTEKTDYSQAAEAYKKKMKDEGVPVKETKIKNKHKVKNRREKRNKEEDIFALNFIDDKPEESRERKHKKVKKVKREKKEKKDKVEKRPVVKKWGQFNRRAETKSFDALMKQAAQPKSETSDAPSGAFKIPKKKDKDKPSRPMTQEERERTERRQTKEYQQFLEHGGKRPTDLKERRRERRERDSSDSSPEPVRRGKDEGVRRGKDEHSERNFMDGLRDNNNKSEIARQISDIEQLKKQQAELKLKMEQVNAALGKKQNGSTISSNSSSSSSKHDAKSEPNWRQNGQKSVTSDQHSSSGLQKPIKGSSRSSCVENENVLVCGPSKKSQPTNDRDRPENGTKIAKADTAMSAWDRIYGQIQKNRPAMAKPSQRSKTGDRNKRKHVMSESEEDLDDFVVSDEEDDMDGFIDDSGGGDVSKHIKAIFGYDKNRFADEDSDCDDMEVGYAQQMKEEIRSAKIGRQEDLEDIRREEEEERRKREQKKKHKSSHKKSR